MDKVEETYDALASQYAERSAKLHDIKKETTGVLLSYLHPGDEVLDVGCGVGLDTFYLSKKCRVTGFDISRQMLAEARALNAGNPFTTFMHGSFRYFEFGTRRFHGIFANAFIHLFPTGVDVEILGKMHHLLYSDGVAFISTTKETTSLEGWHKKRDYRGSSRNRFRKFWTEPALRKAIERVGFTIDHYFENVDPFDKHFMYFIARK